MFSYVPTFIPNSIYLIGAGGTGSRLIPMLAQLVRTCLRQFNPTGFAEVLSIYIIDGDKVEEKNLLRQNFISKDVGKYKASVLASRYSNAFGITITPCNQFIKNSAPLVFEGIQTIRHDFQNSIVILALDSADARREVLRYILRANSLYERDVQSFSKIFFIDAGNEDAFGQIKFFTPNILAESSFPPSILDSLAAKNPTGSLKHLISEYIRSYPNKIPNEYQVNYIPMDVNYYMNLGSSAQELSCAELPQTLAINAMMATLITAVVQNFLYLKPMAFDGIRFSMSGAVSTEYNSPKAWLNRCCERATIGKFTNIAFEQTSKFIIGAGKETNLTGFEIAKKDAIKMFESAGMKLNDDGEFVQDIKNPPPLKEVTEEKIKSSKPRAKKAKQVVSPGAITEEDLARIGEEVLNSLAVTNSPPTTTLTASLDTNDAVTVSAPQSPPILRQVEFNSPVPIVSPPTVIHTSAI